MSLWTNFFFSFRTFPEPEVTSSGLLNASAQVFGILLTMRKRVQSSWSHKLKFWEHLILSVLVGGWLLGSYGDMVCNGALLVFLAVGAILTFFIRSDLRRQQALQSSALKPNITVESNEQPWWVSDHYVFLFQLYTLYTRATCLQHKL